MQICLAVPGAAQEDVAELPVGPQGMGLAVVGDVAAAVDERHAQVEPLALHQHDPLGADPALVALELPRDPHGAVDVAAAGVGGDRRQQERILDG